MTISREAFMKLRRGDIVLFGARNTPRIVEEGPGNWVGKTDGRPHQAVIFSKLRPSWTNRGSTCYLFNDVKDKLTLPRKKRDKRKVRKYLNDRLREMGFDPRKETVREAKELKRLIRVMNYHQRFVCSTGHRWPKGS